MKDNQQVTPSLNCRAFLLLAVIIVVSYGNSLHNGWHLDDIHTIIDNPKLHLTDLSFQSIAQTFYASTDAGNYSSSRLYRPIPNITFALNWFVGQDNVVGYHITNIAIHILTSFLLFLTVQLLLLTPNCRVDRRLYSFIPLFTATLWAINPIHVSAVTYVVQRMAMFAAFFTILSTYFYLKARLCDSQKGKITFGVSCFICFVLAYFSKENSIMMPFSLGLLEFLFFRKLLVPHVRRILLFASCFGVSLFVIVHVFHPNFIDNYIDYSSRSFTLVERLLTEARVVVLYLSLMFYPLAERFSFQHDIGLSASLLSPPSTLMAIVFILMLVFFALYQWKTRPLVSFGILFYFLNHIIESSVIPLELTFEHRNYLPSLFVFLPISFLALSALQYFSRKKIFLTLIGFSLSLVLTMVALGTYSRNKVWYSDESLWLDVYEKYPDNYRASFTLAEVKVARGDLVGAIELFRQCLDLAVSAQSPVYAHSQALTQMSMCYYQVGRFDEAIAAADKALKLCHACDVARRPLVKSYIAKGSFPEAMAIANEVIARRPTAAFFVKEKGLILLKQGRPREAISVFLTADMKEPITWQISMLIGIALDEINKHQHALWFLRKAQQLSPNNILPLLGIIQNRLAIDKQEASQYIKFLLDEFDTVKIIDTLRGMKTMHIYPPLQNEKIAKAIADELNNRAVNFSKRSL